MIELRLPPRGEVDLVRVRHLDDAFTDLQLDELGHSGNGRVAALLPSSYRGWKGGVAEPEEGPPALIGASAQESRTQQFLARIVEAGRL